jgi:hypothetical protein
MRTTLIAATFAGSLAALLTACGGGGGTASTPAVVTSPLAVASMSPSQSTSTFTGPTSTLSVTIQKPQLTAPSDVVRTRIRAMNGNKTSNPYIRTMATVSPTQSIRTAASQQNRYAAAVEQSTRRDPSYVSGATQYMEFVLTSTTSGTTGIVDDVTSCPTNSTTCTATFTNIPVGGPYTASLFLYDTCPFLLSAGSSSNLLVAATNNPQLTINLSGVVAYFDVTTNASQFVGDASGAQTGFTVSVTPEDADYNTITNLANTTAPMVDENLNAVTGVTLTPTENLNNGSYVTPTDVTPSAPQTVGLTSPVTVAPATYNFLGTGNESYIIWSAAAVTSTSPIVATGATGPHGNGWSNSSGSATGSLNESVTGVLLNWQNPNGYPIASSDPKFTNTSSGTGTTTSKLEFPGPNNASTITLGLSENVAFTGNVTLSDDGSCAGIVSAYVPTLGAYPYSQLSTSPYVQLQMGSSSAGTCTLTATDNAATPRTATLNIAVDPTSTITIQNTARKH